jgi:hypothetical protein
MFACSKCDEIQVPGLGTRDDEPTTDPTTVFEHEGEMREESQRVGNAFFENFNVDVQEGDRLVVTASSSAFDPVIQVTLPGEATPLTNDDWQGSREHAQLALSIPQTGAMKISVTSYDATPRGRYRVLVRRMGAPPSGGNEPAQENNVVVSVGSTHEGELTATDPRTADGRAFDQILVQVGTQPASLQIAGTGALHPMAIVLNPRGQSLAAGAGGAFLLAEPGVHRAQVMAPASGVTGAYRVTVAASTGPQVPVLARSHHQIPQTAQAQAVTLGQTVSGALAGDDARLPSGEPADFFDLQIGAASDLRFELNSATFDPYLMVVGPNGQYWENDDSTGTNSMLLVPGAIAGLYRVIATAYRATESGSYELKVLPGQRDLGQVASNAQSNTVRGALQQGDATLQSGEFVDTHTFTLAQGQSASFEVRSSEFDTYLIVRPPSGPQQDNDDQTPGNTNSRVDYVASQAGPHQVMVTSYRPGETGNYELVTTMAGGSTPQNPPNVPPNNVPPNNVPPNVPPNNATPEAITANQTRGTLAPGDRQLESGEYADYYTMTFNAGEAVQLRLESSAFDTYLIVRTPAGRQQDNDDLVSGNTSSGLDIPVAEQGEYTIIVTSYRPGETGAYTLTRGAGAAVPRPDGQSGQGGRVFGLFAGITDYPGGGDLPECANDAIKLAEALRNRNLLTPDRQIILTDGQATVANIRSGMQRMASQIGPDDVFVFFYSGHGGQTPGATDSREIDGSNEFLQVYDGPLVDDELGTLFDGIRGRLSLIALDACHSGGFAKDVITRPGRVGMFSSEEDVLSAVASQFQAGGYLSHFLRTGVSGEADTDPTDNVLTVGELTHYVYRQFGAHAQDIHMAATYQHLVVDRGAVGVDQVFWSYR